MSKTVVIHQPDFAPWLGFFDRLAKADLYLIFDDVQFVRRGWHHRDRIKGPNGTRWLTLPILKKSKFDQRISATHLVDDRDWKREHLQTLRHCYSKAPYFDAIYPELEEIYAESSSEMMKLNIRIIKWMLEKFSISIPIEYSSSYPSPKRRNERLIQLLKATQATAYLTGTGSRNYLDEYLFSEEGIVVKWQSFKHPIYPQLHGAFEAGLSSIDYLFNCGPANPFH